MEVSVTEGISYSLSLLHGINSGATQRGSQSASLEHILTGQAGFAGQISL